MHAHMLFPDSFGTSALLMLDAIPPGSRQSVHEAEQVQEAQRVSAIRDDAPVRSTSLLSAKLAEGGVVGATSCDV